MSNRSKPASTRKGGAPASALLGGVKAPSKIIEGEVATTEPPSPPSSQEPAVVDSEALANAAEARQREVLEHQALVREGKLEDVSLEEHKKRQAAYRATQALFEAEKEATAAPVADEGEHQPSEEEIAAAQAAKLQLEQHEWLQAYEAALAEDREQGLAVYVVGRRAPRPKWRGVPLNIGDVVPGAAAWPRIDSWVNTGVVQQTTLVVAG